MISKSNEFLSQNQFNSYRKSHATLTNKVFSFYRGKYHRVIFFRGKFVFVKILAVSVFYLAKLDSLPDLVGYCVFSS